MNKNRIIAIVILVAVVALPYWRIKHNSQFFADGLLAQLEELGDWSHQSVDAALSGEIVINKLIFKPNGYQQTITIDAIEVQTDLKKLLFSGANDLRVNIPKSMTMSFQNARISNNANDLQTAVNLVNYWPMAGSFLGAFGCGEAPGPSFSDQQWQQIFPSNPSFDLVLSYSLLDDYHIDFNLNVDSPDNWFIAWSGTLARTTDSEQITFTDTIVDTLYYYQNDLGFNRKRNQVCADANKGNYAAYRLNSADALQKYLRVYAGQEMSAELNNKYQRALAENVELNAIFDFSEPRYIFEVLRMSQMEYYANVDIEVALGESEYEKVVLSDIDYLDLDLDTLRAEMEAKQEEAKRVETEANKPKELLRTVTRTIGKSVNEVTITNWSTAVGENIKVRTKRGRPIFGELLSINDKQLTISSKYMSGNATITVMRKDVVSMSVSR